MEKPSQDESLIDKMPPLLRSFAELIGVQATMALVQRYGGLRIFIPTVERCSEEHPLAQIVGLDKLQALAGEYGGIEHFQLPKADRITRAIRNARICADRPNKSVRQLAEEYGLTESQIVRILRVSGVTSEPYRKTKKNKRPVREAPPLQCIVSPFRPAVTML